MPDVKCHVIILMFFSSYGLVGNVYLESTVKILIIISYKLFSSQRNAFANDTIPSESYISAIQAAHLGTLSCQSLPLASSLKHILLSLVRLTGDLIV